MGRISQFQQQGLASSLVGTPGADYTAATALSNISSSLASIDADMNETKRQKLLAEKALKEIEKARNEAFFQTELAKQDMEYETLLMANAEQYKKEDLTTAQNKVDSWHKQYSQTVLQRYTDPVQRARVEETLTKSYSSFSKSYTNTINTERTKGLISDLEVASKDWNSANAFSSIGESADVVNKKIMERYAKNEASYQGAYGADWRKYWSADQADAINEWFNAVAYRNPGALRAALDSKVFDSSGVEPSDLNRIYSRAESLQRTAEAEQRREEKLNEMDLKQQGSLDVANANDETSLRDIVDDPNQHITVRTAATRKLNSLKKQQESEAERATVKQNVANKDELVKNWKTTLASNPAIRVALKGKKAQTTEIDTLKVSDIEDAMDTLVQANASNAISPQAFATQTEALKKIMNAKLGQKTKTVSPAQAQYVSMSSSLDKKALDNITKNYNLKDPVRAVAVNSYQATINELEEFHRKKTGRDPNKQEYETITQIAVKAVLGNPEHRPTPGKLLPTVKPAVKPKKPTRSQATGAALGADITKYLGR